MERKLTRRDIGRGLAAGALVGVSGMPAMGAVAQGAKDAKWLPVAPGVWRATFGTPEPMTPVSSRAVPPHSEGLSRMGAVAQPPLPAPQFSAGARGTQVRLPLAAEEQVYGFGLQFFSVQHRGRKITTRVNADPLGDTGDSHAPVPFYVSSNGYGVLVDTARYASFYCGDARPKPQPSAAAVAGATAPLYTRNLTENQDSQVVVEVPVAQGVQVYLFAGPSMLEAVRRYNLFSGGGVMPPDWGLGFWYRMESNATGGAITALADEFRERKIPCDVIGLEPGWQTHAYSCTFAWESKRYPDPAAFLNGMKSRNFHVNLWEHAYINPASPLFAPMQPLSGDHGVWGGLAPDFADARAREVFGDYHGKILIDAGVDGFKLDECDNSDYTGGWSFPELSRFPSGVDGEQMHSVFGLRYQDTIWAPFKTRKRQTYGLVRSSGALAAPYPFVLYSDLYDHRQFIRALVNSGFSGLLWCPEVRDARDEEDLVRRLQAVIFSPLAMVNGWYITNPPWKQINRAKNNAGELFADWHPLEARCREIINWRMQLLPYLRAAFARYAADGTPPFRALALDWPDHPELARVDDAWMVGDRMLVAPLFAGEPGRTVHLPPGTWHNFWTGAEMTGGRDVMVPSGEANIPVFVRGGSVFPMAEITNTTADKAARTMHVRVFGDGALPFELHAPGESLVLSWDAKERQGRVRQAGDPKYEVRSWSAATA